MQKEKEPNRPVEKFGNPQWHPEFWDFAGLALPGACSCYFIILLFVALFHQCFAPAYAVTYNGAL